MPQLRPSTLRPKPFLPPSATWSGFGRVTTSRYGRRSTPLVGKRRISWKPPLQTKGDDMRHNLKSLLSVSTLFVGLIAAPALYAQDEPTGSQNRMMGQGRMNQGGTMQDGQGMRKMMGQMNQMMGTCHQMSQAMKANKIGRASCRERVWQYVKLRVVGVQ